MKVLISLEGASPQTDIVRNLTPLEFRDLLSKPGIDSILKQGNIIEFAFDGKPNNIGIYVGRDQTGHTIILLEHPAFVPGTLMTYSYMDDVKLFKGTVTLSND